MPRTRGAYPREFKARMVELVRAGRSPDSLAKEFEPSANSIRNWAQQADRDEDHRSDGLTTQECVVNKPAEANPRVADIEAQLRALDDASRFLGRREIKELPNILWDSEQIHDVVQGSYDSGLGILVSTDRRLIFVNKGMIYGLKVEDFPNDKITSIQYETKLLFGSITIFASGNKAVVKDVDKNQARTFAERVRARLAAGSFPATEQPSPSGGPTENDMAGQLEKLAALKEKGILTEEEFTAKKKQILSISWAERASTTPRLPT